MKQGAIDKKRCKNVDSTSFYKAHLLKRDIVKIAYWALGKQKKKIYFFSKK